MPDSVAVGAGRQTHKQNPKFKSVWAANEVLLVVKGQGMESVFCWYFVVFFFSNPFEIQNCRHLASFVLCHACIATHTHTPLIYIQVIGLYMLFWGHLPWEVLVGAEKCPNSWGIICPITAIPREPLYRKPAAPSCDYLPASVTAVIRLPCFGISTSGNFLYGPCKADLVFYNLYADNLFCNNLYWLNDVNGSLAFIH